MAPGSRDRDPPGKFRQMTDPRGKGRLPLGSCGAFINPGILHVTPVYGPTAQFFQKKRICKITDETELPFIQKIKDAADI
ncbi:hypothetical protein GN956_G12490 [Arapaima gigas]